LDARATDHLVAVGETLAKTLRVSRDEIMAFARMSHDMNLLHGDTRAAQRARFGEIIASGQHTVAILMGMIATYFSRHDDGVMREMCCLEMNFDFKGPVFADQAVTLQWKVASTEWNVKLEGVVARLDGQVGVATCRPALVARGSILVKEAVA
jgi:acyl dehydratase